MDYTINLRTNNTEQLNAFLSFVKSIGLADVINVKRNDTIIEQKKKYNAEKLILAPLKKVKAVKYYGLWKEKEIVNIKQFRDNLWERK